MKPAKIAKPPASTPNTPGRAIAVREVAALRRPAPDEEHRRDRRGVDDDQDDDGPEQAHARGSATVSGVVPHGLHPVSDDELRSADREDRGRRRVKERAWPRRSRAMYCRFPTSPRSGSRRTTRRIPDTAFPPIVPLRPPEGAPNVLFVLIDDVGFGASSAFGGPVNMPNAERLAATGLKYNRFHTTALCSPTRAALLSGRNHHTVGMGGITEIATSAPGLQLDPPEHLRAARADPQAERLLDGAVRQVPRGAGLGDEPDGPVRQLADRERLRVLLRLHRRRGPSVLPGDLRGHDPGRAREDPGRGLPLHGRHDGQGDQVGPPAEGADAGQAVLRLLRARRDARAAPRHARVGRQVQGRVRRRLGRAARADLRPPEGARRDPGGRRADGAPRRRSRPGTTCRRT